MKKTEHEDTFPKAVFLKHEYTPANFSRGMLKQNDTLKVATLTEAAEKAGYFAKLGLITHYQMGDWDNEDYDYYSSYYSNEPGEGEMGEIYEEYIQVKHWEEKGIPGLGDVGIAGRLLFIKIKSGYSLQISHQ